MNEKNYKFVIPISTSECLEVSPKRLPDSLHDKSNPHTNFKIYVSEPSAFETYIEITPDKYQQNEIMRILKVTHKGLSRYFDRNETFIVASNTGFQVIRSSQILYFEYAPKKKQWIAYLTDLSSILLKRNTSASIIMDYSASFIRISQQCIVNLNHLVKIEGNECVMTVSANNSKLLVSRIYLKSLQETIRMI